MNDHDDFEHGSYSIAPPESGESMESRIRRLETALAAMQDTRLMEDRVVDKVVSRIDQAPAQSAPSQSFTATPPADPASGMMYAVGSQLDAMTSPAAQSEGSLFSAKTWLLTDFLQELRTFGALYFDFRYKTTLAAKVVPPLAFVLFVLSWTLVHGSVVFIGSLLDYVFDCVLAILVYKTLQREAARYRAAVATLPPRAVVK
jgi:hypothetical protein